MPSAATCQPLSSDGIVSVQEPSATPPLTPAHVMQVIYLEVFLFFYLSLSDATQEHTGYISSGRLGFMVGLKGLIS